MTPSPATSSASPTALAGDALLRGLLENDLLIEKFFQRYEATLSVSHAKGLNELMELSDNDLLDLLLRRKEPGQLSDLAANTHASTPEALGVLSMLRPGATAP